MVLDCLLHYTVRGDANRIKIQPPKILSFYARQLFFGTVSAWWWVFTYGSKTQHKKVWLMATVISSSCYALHFFAICQFGGDLPPYVCVWAKNEKERRYNSAKQPNSGQVSSLGNQYSGSLQDDSSGQLGIYMKHSGKKRRRKLGHVHCNRDLSVRKVLYMYK